jgi:hypothetical protein
MRFYFHAHTTIVTTVIKLFLFVSILCMPVFICAQDGPKAKVFQEFSDLEQDAGIPHHDYLGIMKTGFRCYAFFTDGPRKARYSFKDIWGFSWRNDLYRVDAYDMPIRLMEDGEICFWQAEHAYISKGIDGELVKLPHADRRSNAKSGRKTKAYKRFEKEGNTALCDCLNEADSRLLARICVEEHNNGELVESIER